MTITAQFTVDQATGPALLTCLRAMAGVGQAISESTLSVEVYEPFEAERMDQVRAIILDIDSTATEIE